MKVYYDMFEDELSEDFIEQNLSSYDGKEKEQMRTIYQILSKTQNELKSKMFIKIKYQLMWALRSIEKEIKDEGGSITITKKMQIETKGFTEELTHQIQYLLSKGNFE